MVFFCASASLRWSRILSSIKSSEAIYTNALSQCFLVHGIHGILLRCTSEVVERPVIRLLCLEPSRLKFVASLHVGFKHMPFRFRDSACFQ